MRETRLAVYLDIENLVHPFRESGLWGQGIGLVASFLRDVGRMGTVVVALAVCDRDAWRHVAFPMAELGVRVFAHSGGPDAADVALVEHIRGELPPSVGTIVIASGDHLFAAVASELRAEGRQVVAASLPGALSHQLYGSVDSTHLLCYEPTRTMAA